MLGFTLATLSISCSAQASGVTQPVIRSISAGQPQVPGATQQPGQPRQLDQVRADIRAWLVQQEEVDRRLLEPEPSALDRLEESGQVATATPITTTNPAQQPVIRAFLSNGGKIETTPVAAMPRPTAVAPSQQVVYIPNAGAPRFCAWPMTCPKPTARRVKLGGLYGSGAARSPSQQSMFYAMTAPLNHAAFQREIDYAAASYGVDPLFVRAIMHAESSFNHRARSPVGAQGLMQLMPATARRFGVINAYAPLDNIQGGTQYLAYLLRLFRGDMRLAAAAYNAGEGAVSKYNGIPPYRETIDYVGKVTTLFGRYHAATR